MAAEAISQLPRVTIGPPASAARRRRLTLQANEEVGPSIHVLTLAVAPNDRLDFVPGQYVTFYLPRDGRSVIRSYSIFSSSYTHDRLSLLIKKVPGGFGSTYLCELSARDRPQLDVLAPLGKFVLAEPGGRTAVFVGTGVGVAPFVPMLEYLHDRHPETPAWLFWGNRSADDLVRRDALDGLAERWPSFRFVPIVSRPPPDDSWRGAVGHVEEHLRSALPDLRAADVYLCGANAMVGEMQALALASGAPKERVFVDRWGEHTG